MKLKIYVIPFFLLSFLLFSKTSWAQVNEPPIVEATGDQLYCPLESINIATSVTITDIDNTGTESMFIQISEGYEIGQDILTLTGTHPNLTAVWDASTGKLTLNSVSGGEVLYSEFIAAILDVGFTSFNANITGEKAFSITWGDANYLPSTGHFYEYIPDLGITWSAAKSAAEVRTYFGLQGYLATLTSVEEAQLSGEQAEGAGWIGGSDEAIEGDWRWVTGPEAGTPFWSGLADGNTTPPYNFAFWNSGEPNQSGNEDYAHITAPSIGILGSWNDLSNTGSTDPTSPYHPQGYIVEYGGLPGDPDINISASTKITVPSILNTIPNTICGSGNITLEAYADFGVINWYDSNTSTTPVFSGEVFSTPLSTTTTFYVLAANSTTCSSGIRQTVIATVNPTPTTFPPSIYTQCDDETNNGLAFFNLTLEEIKLEIAPDYLAESLVFTYYNSQLDAQNNVSPIPDPTNYQNAVPFVIETVWIRIENPNGCYNVESIDLEVTPSSAALAAYNPTPIYQCDDGSDLRDGISTFNLTAIHNEIQDVVFPSITVAVHFYESLSDAELENNEIIDITNHQNTNSPTIQDIWVRVKSDLGNNCLGLEDFPNLLNVEALPFANMPTTVMKQCDDNHDGFFAFDTSTVESEVLNGQSLTDVTISYFNQDGSFIGNVLPNPFSTQSQVIDIVVTNNTTNDPDGACTDATTLEFIVDDLPEAFVPSTEFTLCDDEPDPTDGISVFNTSTLEAEILGGQTGMNVYYFDSTGTNPLVDSFGNTITSPFPAEFSTASQTITVTVENPLNTSCLATITVDFTVNNNPIFDLIDEDMICENILPHQIAVENPDQTDYLYQWYDANGTEIPAPEGTSQILTITNTDDITSAGVQYSVEVTNPTTLCSTTKSIQLSKSSIATITDEAIITVEFSSPNNSIEINTDNLGSGDYEFSLEHDSDYRYPQDEPLFTNLVGGVYTLIITDKNGCGQIEHEIVLLDYPKFLTPNNDGYNDTWKLIGLESNTYTVSPIQIYDRYGKVIKVLDPYGDGWDGYFNGKALPSTDYWFALQLTDNNGNTKNYKGHFSLIRR